MPSADTEVGFAPEGVIQHRNAELQKHLVHVIRATGVVVIASAIRSKTAHRTTATIHKWIGTRLVDGGRRRGADAGRVWVTALAVMLFAIFIAGSDRDRTGPTIHW